MSRKKLPIDPVKVKELAQLGATVKEIAHFLRCSDTTINNRFQAELDEGRAALKVSIRRAQIRVAIEKESPVLLIWLGKQMLGQKETQDINFTEKKEVISDEIADQLLKKLGD